MSGPVWRMKTNEPGSCSWCLNESTVLLVEGVVEDGSFHELRAVCPSCFAVWKDYLLSGEKDQRTAAPAYAHR